MRSYAKVSDRLWTGSLGKAIRGDHATQALASYLLSCPHNNMIGLFHFAVDYAQVDMGMKPKQAVKSMEALADLGFLRWDRDNDRVWIVEQWRHELNAEDIQPRDKRRPAALETLRRHLVSPLVAAFAARYPATATGLDLQEAPSKGDTGNDNDSGKPHRSQEQEQEQQQEQEPKRASARGVGLQEFDPPFDSEPFRDALQTWVTHRAERGCRIKPESQAWKLQRKAIIEMGEARAIAAIEHSAANNYQALVEPRGNGRVAGGAKSSRPPSRHAPRVAVEVPSESYDDILFHKGAA